jgi:hypothetical protein
MAAVDLPGGVSLHDVGMAELRREGDFLPEALQGIGIGQDLIADQLDGRRLAGRAVAGLEDLAHAALADAVQEKVRTDDKVFAPPLD